MNDMSHFTFHRLLKTLLKTHSKHDIFLRTNKSLKHPHKEIEYIKENEEFLVEIMVNFMGLQGNTSQLPSYILDKLSRNEDDGTGWSLFFDYFNHYILWVFFESINIKNYPRSFKSDFSDSISKILFAILGIQNKGIANHYLPFAPLLLSSSRPKYYIEKVLQNNFNLHNKLSIIENIPHQIFISPRQQNKLGIKNHILGNNAILGTKFTSYQSKIAILIKDIEFMEALEYLPNKQKYNHLKESVSFLTNNEFCIDLYLKINFNKKMNLILGNHKSAKLGWGLMLNNTKQPHHTIHINLCE